MNIDLRLGDCLEVLKTFPENSIDSIVTDSPYGLSFMGKKWDYDVPSVEIWEECLRVLKPGGHLLSFAGSRTYHRMAVRIEDAGFEIRDQIMWVYGSGFPKSHNIGKAIDKIEGNEREIVDMVFADGSKPRKTSTAGKYSEKRGLAETTKGNSEWEGWGSALKPSHEPIVMARKPLSEKSIAENVLKHGTGGINIDGSRIEGTKRNSGFVNPNSKGQWGTTNQQNDWDNTSGRFPANIIFDEEAGKLLDEQSGYSKSRSGKRPPNEKIYGGNSLLESKTTSGETIRGIDDQGGASRFFYCPKASKKDRNEGLDHFELKENTPEEIINEIKSFLSL